MVTPPRPATARSFERAIDEVRSLVLRSEIALDEVPAPTKLAPYAAAFTGEIVLDEDLAATGRLVLLHDPAGHEAWHGRTRCVVYIRANVEAEMATDPFVGEVAWSWVLESLRERGARFTAAGGTVTRVSSQPFGDLAARGTSGEIEIRASWTPLAADLRPHANAWADVLCISAGVPLLPPQVAVIRPRAASDR
jgi:hypothetical protein